MNKKSRAISVGIVFIAGIAHADDRGLADQLAACAEENLDAARLACYDAIARTPEPIVEAEPAPAAATTTPVATTNPVDEFGKVEEKDDAEVREISAMATAVKKRPAGQLLITLDNGQVWTEKDHETHFRVRPGDTVKIKKGRWGGFTMVTSARRSSAVTRVQ